MKNFRKVLVAAALLAVLFLLPSCDDSIDYGAVSVDEVTKDDISASYSGSAVADKAEFETKILTPLMGEMTTMMMSQMQNTIATRSTDSRAMAAFIDESATSDETIDLSLDPDFTSGTINQTGSVDIYGEKDDTNGYPITLDADVNASMTASNVATVANANNEVFKADGKVNARALAKFEMSATDAGALKIDLDYGVAVSAAVAVSVNDSIEEVGAIVVLNFKLADSNHSSYDPSAYQYAEAMFGEIIADSLPDTASLEVSVFNNAGTQIFTESYDYNEVMTLINS